MAVKIRMSRHGKKNYAFYHIVVADSRAPRDGRFIELLGTYNPNTNPASITINNERALYWLGCGAQPTETCRRILSYKGVLLMKHLRGGVKKGAFDEAAAQSKFDAWKQQKQNNFEAIKADQEKNKKAAKDALLLAEKKANEAKAKAIAEKKAAAEAAQNAAEAEAATEETQEETPAEA